MAGPPPRSSRAFITSLITSLSSKPSSAAESGADGTKGQETVIQQNPSSTTARNPDPLKTLSENQRNILLTLHVLFPHELLPALDLLDRDLVTRFTVVDDPATATVSSTRKRNIYYVRSAQQQQGSSSYYSSKRYRDATASNTASLSNSSGNNAASSGPGQKTSTDHSSKHYEVRPVAWSCSCPAFAFSAFPSRLTTARTTVWNGGGAGSYVCKGTADVGDEDDVQAFINEEGDEADEEEAWTVGGLSLSPTIATRGGNGGGAAGSGISESGGGGGGAGGVPICKHLLACTLVENSELFSGFVRTEVVGIDDIVGWGAGWGG
ncbi:hypothetical protein AAFC00_005228 [Neodothiora populina]|uniref:SWIM-type domain-containing protein n=1 Tax=Neodothiora populina TaxID=2781224 RepID=A0ABR3PK58_9PEZI